jgi:O-antigen/teichoic acid export membrane protein
VSLAANIKRLLSDSVIYGLSGVLTRFISVFLTPIYTRIYTPDDYGVISILTNGYILISIILVFSLDASTGRWFYDTNSSAERKKVINTWIWFYFFSSLIFGALLFFSAGYLQSRFLPNNYEGVFFIQLIAICLPLTIWSTVAINVLRLEMEAKKSVALSLIQSLLLIGLNILFVVILRMGLSGIYYAQLISTVILIPVSYFFIRKWIGSPSWFDPSLFRGMFKFAVPFIPASLGYWMVNLSGVFFLNEFLDQKEVGLYQIGISIASVAGLATTAFQQAWSPFAYSILDKPNAKQVFAISLQVYLLFVGMFCTFISVFSLEALKILTTPDYYEASLVASILTFNSLLIGLGSISTLGATIEKKTTPVGLIYLFSSLVLIGLNFLLIPLLGKEGAAYAVCISQLMIPAYMFWKSQQYYFIPYDFLKNAFILVVYVAVVFVSYWIDKDSFLISVLLKLGLLILATGLISLFIRKELLTVKNIVMARFRSS